MSNPECNFCDPPSFSNRIIGSNEHAISLLSSPRLTPGHSLIIPRRHVETLDQLNGEEMEAVHKLITPVYRRLLGTLALGVDVWQKTRPFVRQNDIKMNHIHFHVIPSDIGDERYNGTLRWSSDQFEALYDNERSEVLRLLSD